MTRFFLALVIASELRAAAPPLDQLLAKTRGQVQRFWDQFPAVHCTEVVSQTKLGENGKPIAQRQSTFDYLVLMQINEDELKLEESRVQRGKPPRATDRALLSTSGFSTLILVFHPHYQASYRFSLSESEDASKLRVHFAPVHGKPTPAVLQLRNREYPIEWEGDASIDPETGAVERIDAALAVPLTDVGLQWLAASVTYAPVGFKDLADPVWLPKEAIIQAQTAHQHWINTHEFSSYKEFAVSVDETQTGQKKN
jgi:hypothetical protein